MGASNQKTFRFPENFTGDGRFKAIAEYLNQLSRVLNNFHIIRGGDSLMTKEFLRLRITPGAVGVAFDGVVYLGGVKFTGLNTSSNLPWVRVNVRTGSVQENAGPAPTPFPPDEVWYEKAKQFGPIYVNLF